MCSFKVQAAKSCYAASSSWAVALQGYSKQGDGALMGSWGTRGGFNSPFRNSSSAGVPTSPGNGGGHTGEPLSGLVAGVARLGIGVGASDRSPSKDRGDGNEAEGSHGYAGTGAQSGSGARAGGGAGAGVGGVPGAEGRGDPGGAPGDAGEDGNSVVAVVCAQRDRFRQRITDLEEVR